MVQLVLREEYAVKNVRIWFRKVGLAKYISHLDLNRCMLRAIHKAKISLWYTQGYNPHPFITFALPLSLGICGERESMDLKLEDDDITKEEIIEKLNMALPHDIKVFDVTEPVMKPGKIAYASFIIKIDPENKNADEIVIQIAELFKQDSIIVSKHTKNGYIDMDIKPYLDKTVVTKIKGKIVISTMIPAGSTFNINPNLLCDSINKYLNLNLFTEITRINIYNESLEEFK